MIKEIFETPDGWYFWNENWDNKYGPYEDELQCKEAYYEYYGDLFDDTEEDV